MVKKDSYIYPHTVCSFMFNNVRDSNIHTLQHYAH